MLLSRLRTQTVYSAGGRGTSFGESYGECGNDPPGSCIIPSSMQAESSGSAETSTFEKHFSLWVAAILAVAGATYLYIAAHDPIFERAEDFFTECAREMWAMGKFITPYMYGVPFIDKPILTYWGMESVFAAFGVSHFTCRVPSVLAALACLALTARAAALVWGKRTAVVATLLLSSSVGFFYFATLAMSDMWLTLCSTAAAVMAGSWPGGC